jgi:hypothetical protein
MTRTTGGERVRIRAFLTDIPQEFGYILHNIGMECSYIEMILF